MTLTILLSSHVGASAQDYTPESLSVTLFSDGRAMIEYRLASDATLSTITVPIFGSVFEQVLVADEEGQLVDYRIEDSSLVMDTLGAPGVIITYTTADLINKTGRLWTFSLESPVDISVKLPADSVIIGLNQIPTSIKTTENQYLMVLPPGFSEVSYILGVLGTKEDASEAISSAEETISDLKAGGIIVSEAEKMLADAKQAFERSNYSDAEKLASDATALANEIKKSAEDAAAAMSSAEASIEEARAQGLSVAEAEELLRRATLAYDNASYEDSLLLAQQAKGSALGSMTGDPEDDQYLSYLIPSVIGAAAGGTVTAVYIRTRRRNAALEQLQRAGERSELAVKEKRVIDLEKIYSEKPYLRQEDKDAINYLAENGGEAFESEIRDKFQLPKTTVWRLVKRLAREDLVEVKKAGGQNLIRIREAFTRAAEGPAEGTGK